MKLLNISLAATALLFSVTTIAQTKVFSCAGLADKGTVLTAHADTKTNKVTKLQIKTPNGWDETNDKPNYRVHDMLDETSVRVRNLHGSMIKDGSTDFLVFSDDFKARSGYPLFKYDNAKDMGTLWIQFDPAHKANNRFFMTCVSDII